MVRKIYERGRFWAGVKERGSYGWWEWWVDSGGSRNRRQRQRDWDEVGGEAHSYMKRDSVPCDIDLWPLRRKLSAYSRRRLLLRSHVSWNRGKDKRGSCGDWRARRLISVSNWTSQYCNCRLADARSCLIINQAGIMRIFLVGPISQICCMLWRGMRA